MCSRSSPKALGAWDLHPLGASLCVFVQSRPHGGNGRILCVCVIPKHSHGWADNPRANHFLWHSPSAPKGVRARVVRGSGHPMGWQHPFLGITLLLTPLLPPRGHSQPLYPAKITPQAQLPAHAGPISSKSGGKPPDS